MAVSIADEFVKAIPTAVIAAGTLAAGWVVTQRLTAKWDFYRKRRELDLATVTQFYATYGEFFAIWKIWTMFPERDGKVDAPEDQRRELLARAAAMEGSLETLLVKLAVERELKAPDRRVLACLREGLQCLRESIERRAPIQVNKGRPGVKSDDWLAVPGCLKGSRWTGTSVSSAQAPDWPSCPHRHDNPVASLARPRRGGSGCPRRDDKRAVP